MTAHRPKSEWKKWTGIVLMALLAMDAALGASLYQLSREDPLKMSAERDRLATEAKLLKADVERGQMIRNSLPQVGQDCDTFYRRTFLASAIGYSAVQSDLNSIAASAGLRTTGITFKQKQIQDRGVTEISMSTSVEGNYAAVVKFINALERSKNFYLLNDLHLGSATAGGIKLDLVLRTYFRT
jgi:Tfp pilus assembly protein PilO